MNMDSRGCLTVFGFLVLCCLISTASSQSAKCMQAGPMEVNNTHPSTINGTDTEQWANVTSFCAGGLIDIKCVDEKGEFMGKSERMRNTSVYIATCELTRGLWCRPYGTQHCPDFSAVYTCTCPPTTTTKITKSNSSASTRKTGIDVNRGTKLPTTAAGANPSTVRHNNLPGTSQPAGNSGVSNVVVFRIVASVVVFSFVL